MISYKQKVAKQSGGYGGNLGRGRTGAKAKTWNSMLHLGNCTQFPLFTEWSTDEERAEHDSSKLST